MSTQIKIAVASCVAALSLPALAQGHVTVQPAEAPAGAFTRVDVRVPNEKDDEGTAKVQVQMPDGFYFASYEPVAGWDVEVEKEDLDEPVEIEEGFEATEQVTQITWTAQDGTTIPPGAFQDFGLSVLVPGEAGDTLTFKALQTYEGGEVVRWIGSPDSDEPAPTVAVTEGGEDHHGAASEDEDAEHAEAAAGDSDDGDGMSMAALIVGGLGFLFGGASLVRSRRS